MLFMELLAKQSPGLGGVVLTIQRANTRAARFYADKCKYALCDISPAKTDPFAEPEEYNYDIWAKYVGGERGERAAAEHARVGAEARLQNAVSA